LRQELIRAGGDPRSKIQELKDQHEALDHEQTGVAAAGKNSKASPAAQESESRTLVVQLRAWRQGTTKEQDLAAAREERKPRLAALAREHQALDEETREAKTEGDDQHHAAPPGFSANAYPDRARAPEMYSVLKHAAEERKHLGELDKRAADLQQLDALYGAWTDLVVDRTRDRWMGVVEGIGWILALLAPVVFANRLVVGIVARVAPDSRRRHTVRIAARFAVQVLGVALILVVIFGPPNQLATVLALAGAGL